MKTGGRNTFLSLIVGLQLFTNGLQGNCNLTPKHQSTNNFNSAWEYVSESLTGKTKKNSSTLKTTTSAGTTYYFDGLAGDDTRDGLSPETAWKSISKTSTMNFEAGDRILLKKGTQFTNQYISLTRQKGSASAPILIDAYGEGSNPIINPSPLNKHAIVITGCEYLEVQNLEITGGSGGVFFTWLDEIAEFHHFKFRNLDIHDCYLGNGSAFQLNMIPKGEVRKSEYTDILIENCRISMIARSAVLAECLNNVDILNNRIQDTGGPGIVLHKSFTGIIQGNHIQSTGSKKHPTFNGRGSCAWLLGCRDILVEKNIFENANGWLDSYGFHLDIWITDPSGKIILHESLAGTCSIDLNSLTTGLYFLTVSYNYNREHFKIMKK